jgi:serine/threonine-protein kinase
MNPERLRQIEELYHAAHEREPGERESFLAQACPGDDELRREVLSLLARDSAGGPMARAVKEIAAALLKRDEWEPGTKVGPYRILCRIAEGGMGQVYKALDTRLDRPVAIKVAHLEFSGRFQREARAISSLNHANICTLYDIGPNYLVMEFIEGETLAQRLQKGRFPTDLVLFYGAGIANALAAAHANDIVHRDLKPGNIMITGNGIKVLDFGLAKLTQGSDSGRSPAEMATVSHAILGTPAYMSPEQFEREECDTRTDIFALGLVLYEMATGTRRGAADGCEIATAEGVPPYLAHLIERCLAKAPDDRWQTAHDLALELAWMQRAPALCPISGPRGLGGFERGVWIAAVAAMLLGSLWLTNELFSRRVPDQPLTRLTVELGSTALTGSNTTVAISPDGRRLVFPTRGPDGKQRLATRLLDEAQPTFLAGTEGGFDPFFSPDSEWIGFLADRKLKKTSVHGGAPVTIAGVGNQAAGASWGDDGNIIMASNLLGPLSRVPAAGGTPTAVTKLRSGEASHRWPQVLPGAQAVLFTSSPQVYGRVDDANIEAVSLKTGQVKIVQHGGYYGRYLPSGHLVYAHEGMLFGAGFDLARLEMRGTPVPLLSDLATNGLIGGGQYDFPANPSGPGTLIYLAGRGTIASWGVGSLDSSGRIQPLISRPAFYVVPLFSPDGRRLTYTLGGDIYVYDLGSEATTRLTFSGTASFGKWAPDGQHIVFTTHGGLTWIRSDGTGSPRRILEAQNENVYAWSFSPDGRRLSYHEYHSATGFDIWVLPLDLTDPDRPRAGKPELFAAAQADEMQGRFSPDGRWIAYRSNESGDYEIYVRPSSAVKGGKWQISTGGGWFANWSRNGRELFFEDPDNRIMVMEYAVKGESFVAGKPRPWCNQQLFTFGTTNLDLAPDGKHFAVLYRSESDADQRSMHVTMLLNFFDEVRRRVHGR